MIQDLAKYDIKPKIIKNKMNFITLMEYHAPVYNKEYSFTKEINFISFLSGL